MHKVISENPPNQPEPKSHVRLCQYSNGMSKSKWYPTDTNGKCPGIESLAVSHVTPRTFQQQRVSLAREEVKSNWNEGYVMLPSIIVFPHVIGRIQCSKLLCILFSRCWVRIWPSTSAPSKDVQTRPIWHKFVYKSLRPYAKSINFWCRNGWMNKKSTFLS